MDGDVDCVRVAQGDDILDFDGESAVTLECWFMAEGVTSGSTGTLMRMGEEGMQGCIAWSEGFDLYGRILCGTSSWYTVSGTMPSDGDFHHIALTWEDDTLRLFLDGALVDSDTTIGQLGSSETDDYLYVGAFDSTYAFVEGAIDEVRVLHAAKYTSAFTPKTHVWVENDTALLWRFNEGTGTTVDNEVGDEEYDGTLLDDAGWGVRTEWYRNYSYDAVGNRTQLVKSDGLEDITVTYTYNTLHQLTDESWSEGGVSKQNLYDYDVARRLISKEEKSGGVRSASWEYEWDGDDHLTLVTKMDGNLDTLYSVEYQYCEGCGGSRKARIKRDENGDIVKWERYEEQGSSTWRTDEKYDSDDDSDIDENDAWRRQRHAVASSQGHLLKKDVVYNYATAQSSTPASSDDYLYASDNSTTVINVFDENGLLLEDTRFEADAFGAEINDSWSDTYKRNLAGLTYDSDIGAILIGSRWYLPDLGMHHTHGSGYGANPSGRHNNGAKCWTDQEGNQVFENALPNESQPGDSIVTLTTVTPYPPPGMNYDVFADCMKDRLKCKWDDLWDGPSGGLLPCSIACGLCSKIHDPASCTGCTICILWYAAEYTIDILICLHESMNPPDDPITPPCEGYECYHI